MSDKLAGLSSQEKRDLLLKALQNKAKQQEPTDFPLSPLQEGMLFLDRLQPGSSQYNVPYALRMRGELNRDALESSLNQLVKRHTAFRTVFASGEEGGTVQRFATFPDLLLAVTDLTASISDANARQEEARRLYLEEGGVPFDLEKGTLYRFHLLRVEEQEHWLLLSTHHIVFDGGSLTLFLQELGELYGRISKGETPTLPDVSAAYTTYLQSQSKWLNSDDYRQQLAYWQTQLAEPLPLLELPADHPHPQVPSGKGAHHTFRLSRETADGLRRLSKDEGATLFMTLLSAYSLLLHRYTGQDDLLIGTPIAGRHRPEFAELVGLLINTIVLRTDLSGQPTFRELLRRVKGTALDAYSCQDVPFPKLVEALNPTRHQGRAPVFQTMFTLERAEVYAVDLPGLAADLIEEDRGTAKFDLTFTVKDTGAELEANFFYSTDLFTAETIERIAGHFQQLLKAIAAHPELEIHALPMLTEAERHQLLVEWNDTAVDLPTESLTHEIVAGHAAAQPHHAVARHGDRTLTYGDLQAKAGQLARRLQQLGVGRDTLVGLCAPRSLELLIGQLAIWQAGGAFVAMDPAHPDERLSYLIEDTGLRVLLTISSEAQRFSQSDSLTVIELDRFESDLPATPVQSVNQPDDLAYVIYTSGSTGRPKGVLVPHRTLQNAMGWHVRQFGLTAADRSTMLAYPGFDASVWEIWSTLTAGGTLHVVEDETLLQPRRLQSFLLENEITHSFAPTRIAEALVDLEWPSHTRLHTLLTGGDRLQRTPRSGLPFTLYNCYGPTECTILATFTAVDSAGAPTIGRPIANARLYVLDAHLEPVPVGVPGELYIGGAGVARGYLNRPELNETAFLQDPFQESGRLYKTGDLVRYRPDGQLEFVGRVDHQVKIRGLRIELGEIESLLKAHDSVADAAAIVVEDRIVGYLLPSGGNVPSESELRTHLRKTVPEYMVPSAFVTLDRFPVNRSGKIDRHALAACAPQPASAAPVLLTDDTEAQILSIWKQVLKRDDVGLQDNFFDLGGHSLLLVQMFEALTEAFDTDLTLLDLFQHTTVASIAHRLRPAVETEAAPVAAAASPRTASNDIAVVGLAARVPGARDVDAFWDNLQAGVESIRRFTRDELLALGESEEALDDPDYVPVKGVLDDADRFDAAFFGITPRDAETLDPQQRIFLETAWSALEHAGIDPERPGQQIGVFAGQSLSTYLIHHLLPNRHVMRQVGEHQVMMNNDKDFLATRTAFKLNLKGPAVTVQTACSTSLVAVHTACRELLDGQCDTAIAGGVSITMPLAGGYFYQEGSIMSPTGHVHAFDETAQGTVTGNGAGAVVLKRLDDALRDGDTIYSVIKGTAVNNDGSLKVGFTAPSIDGQSQVVAKALQTAGVSPESVTYIEAHGTGTPLGDPIEIASLTKAYREAGATANGYCAVGSVKTNIGHLDAAAGVIGLIKTVLALRNKQLPPSLNFQTANSKIPFTTSPFTVNDKLRDWHAEGPRRAGVSSLGVGGTNAHVILEEAPDQPATAPGKPQQLLVLSAKTEGALERATDNLLAHLQQKGDGQSLADIAYTLQTGRQAFAHRLTFAVKDTADAIEQLTSRTGKSISIGTAGTSRQLVFLFPGQGAQYVQMARGLYDSEALFRSTVDHCADLLTPLLGLDLRDVLYPAAGQEEAAAKRLSETSLTQPALFVIEYALAQLVLSWGLRPSAMIGHSIGEYAAACLSGVFPLEDALRLVAARGRLIQSCERGDMLAVSMAKDELLPLLGDRVSVAAVNAPASTVVSGPADAVARLQDVLTGRGVTCRLLHTSHAFHSAMMDPILDPFRELVKSMRLSTPRTPFLSNVSGTWITAEQAVSADYWAQHLRQAVLFADGLSELFAVGDLALLEVGPGQTLSMLARQHNSHTDSSVCITTMRHPQRDDDDLAVLLQGLGKLWTAGIAVDWTAYHGDEPRRRVPLPTYSFERTRHWVDAPKYGWDSVQAAALEVAATSAAVDSAMEAHDDSEEDLEDEIASLVKEVWQEVLGIYPSDGDADFFELGGDSLMASRVINRLREMLPLEITIRDFFNASTVDALAEKLDELLTAALSEEEEV